MIWGLYLEDMKNKNQSGLFDGQNRMTRLIVLKDSLIAIGETIDFESFRSILENATVQQKKAAASIWQGNAFQGVGFTETIRAEWWAIRISNHWPIEFYAIPGFDPCR